MRTTIKAPATLETFRDVLNALTQHAPPAEVVRQARTVLDEADGRVLHVESAAGAGKIALAQRLIPHVQARIQARIVDLMHLSRLAEVPEGTRFITNVISDTRALPLGEPTRQAARIVQAAAIAGTTRSFLGMLSEVLGAPRSEVPAAASALCAQLPLGPLRSTAEACVAIAAEQDAAEARQSASHEAALEKWARGGGKPPEEVQPDGPMPELTLPRTYEVREGDRAFQLTLLPTSNDHHRAHRALEAAVKDAAAAGIPTFVPGQAFATNAASQVASDLQQLWKDVAARASKADKAMGTAIDAWLTNFGHTV